MPKSETTWGKGKSGNPKGRPRGKRSLTDLLRKGGKRMVFDDIGHLLPANETLANLVWDLMVRGQVSLSGNVYIMRSVDEWLDAVKWLYAHVDGGAELEAAMAKRTGGRSGGEGDEDADETEEETSGELDEKLAAYAEHLASQRLNSEYREEERIEFVDPMKELNQREQIPGGLDTDEDYDRLRRLRRRARRV